MFWARGGMLGEAIASVHGGRKSSAITSFSGELPPLPDLDGAFALPASLAVELCLDSTRPVPGVCVALTCKAAELVVEGVAGLSIVACNARAISAMISGDCMTFKGSCPTWIGGDALVDALIWGPIKILSKVIGGSRVPGVLNWVV